MRTTVEQWDVLEIRLTAPFAGNPFTEVRFGARFTRGHRTVEVEGFHAGNDEWVVRFMPDTQGTWSWLSFGSVTGLDGVEGSFECTAAGADNHGPVSVDKTHHFRYADGTFYSCIGTTSYAWIHHGGQLAERTLTSLKASPFNKLRMTIFPKSYVYNEHDDPALFPFPLLKKGGTSWDGHWDSKGGTVEWRFDFARFDTSFFDMLDQRVRQLRDLGIEADIILFHPYDRWGFAQMSRETDLLYLRYVIARLSAYRNVWWSLANEFDFLHHKTTEDFETIGRTIAECDPYHRLTSIHNGHRWFDHRRSWITHLSVQTSEFHIPRWRDELRKPVVIDEMCYEGDAPIGWGNLTALEMVHRCWDVALNGGYPGHSEVYLTPEHVMWWNKGGVLRGASPARIAFLRRLLESGPDSGVEPHPERMGGLWCACKGDTWLLGYTGTRQPREAHASLREGARYRMTLIDPWAMTSVNTGAVISGASGTTVIPLPAKPYTAFLLEVE